MHLASVVCGFTVYKPRPSNSSLSKLCMQETGIEFSQNHMSASKGCGIGSWQKQQRELYTVTCDSSELYQHEMECILRGISDTSWSQCWSRHSAVRRREQKVATLLEMSHIYKACAFAENSHKLQSLLVTVPSEQSKDTHLPLKISFSSCSFHSSVLFSIVSFWFVSKEWPLVTVDIGELHISAC